LLVAGQQNAHGVLLALSDGAPAEHGRAGAPVSSTAAGSGRHSGGDVRPTIGRHLRQPNRRPMTVRTFLDSIGQASRTSLARGVQPCRTTPYGPLSPRRG